MGRKAPPGRGIRLVGRALVGMLLAWATLEPVRAQGLGEELQRFLYDDASAVVHLRSMYRDRTNPPNVRNEAAWAGGGWVGLETGWLYDTLQLGAVGYTTQPFWAPPPTSDGTGLLKPGGYGFFTLGQAFVSARALGQVFTGYRQSINELEVNPNDTRMIPYTFEAYALRGLVGPVNYFAGYVAAMKLRESSTFINMAERAGAPNVNAGMWLGSLKYGNLEKAGGRTSLYYVPDILTSSYSDGAVTFPVTEDIKLRLMGQFMVQGSNGGNLLTGSSFSTFVAGARANLIWGPLSLGTAYTQVGSAAAYRAPYGIWLGYSSQLVRNFDRAGERAFQAGLAFDFKDVGLPGLLFVGSATFGDRAINPVTRAPLATNNEYDLELAFRADLQPVPDWLKPLQLRARAGYLNQFQDGTMASTTEYRLYFNYEFTFNGPRRAARAP